MSSKLEQICAEMRRLASEAEGMARTAASYAERVEAESRRIEPMVAGNARTRPLVAALRLASRALREDAVTPLLKAARANREIAAGLCGGARVRRSRVAGGCR